jgi:hypothetical protein
VKGLGYNKKIYIFVQGERRTEPIYYPMEKDKKKKEIKVCKDKGFTSREHSELRLLLSFPLKIKRERTKERLIK